MKARVKATGKVVEVKEEYDLRNSMIEVFYSNEENPYEVYEKEELDFDVKEKSFPQDTPDYWTRLEHQAAIAAMQGLVTRGEVLGSSTQAIARDIAEISCEVAQALVEKYKKEERK